MKHSKLWTTLVLGTCLVAAVSCGSDDDDSGSGSSSPNQETQSDPGTYSVTFQPINAGIGGNAAAGTGTITVDEQNFEIKLDVTGVPARVSHLQHIMSERGCPTSDANGDGFIDVVEGTASYGQILIPLDNNLNSQASGRTSGPVADSSGAYTYSRSASYTRMMEDLQAEDTNTEDVVTKLPAGENMNLVGKTVIIHGVPSNVDLPDTVASLPGVSASRTLPIACGVITRTSDGGTTTGDTGTTTGETGTTTGETGTTTGETGTTTGETGTTTGETGTTTGGTTGGTGTTTGGTGTGTTTGA